MEKNELIKNILEIPEETQTIEFKRLSGGNNEVSKIIETIVAMANADGGTIILGVEDPEKTKIKGFDRIFGIEENLDIYDAIGREIQKIIPPLAGIWPPELIEAADDKKRIALISVPKATDNFRSISNHVYVRQNKSNKLLTPQELIEFNYAKGFKKADSELVDIEFHLLATEQFMGWAENRKMKGENIKEILEKTGLARRDSGGKLLPTKAAVLLFAEYPTNLMETKCTIRIFQYAGDMETIGKTLNLLGVPKTIDGPIVRLINDAHDYVLMLLRSGIRIPSGFKTEYKIPERAVKEAITNAVIHRDYYIKRDIEIKIFEDRIEIENAGLFPYNITPANIGHIRASGYRNDLLVKHLREFPNPPNLDQNEGIKAMRSEMKAESLYPPIFMTYPHLQNSVRVILLNEKPPTEWEKVNFYLSENKYITNEMARNATGIIQAYKMSKLLEKWIKQGLLIKIEPILGYRKGVKYRLPETSEFNKNKS